MANMVLARRVWLIAALVSSAWAAPRQHSVLLGKWQTVTMVADSGESRIVKVRGLIVDGRVKEYTSGAGHDVTDRLFVIRRAYRVNDALPQDPGPASQWVWRLGGWISVDRSTGHVAQLNMPVFDPESSEASWYRDCAAYCGTSDDGEKAYLVVWQLGKRKALLRKEFSGPACSAPAWERKPARVTFTAGGEKNSFIVRTHGADAQAEADEGEGP
jgi:hypothetical protein